MGKKESMAKIRTEVLIETIEVLIIKRNRLSFGPWCDACEREVSMLPLGEAALLTGHDANDSLDDGRRRVSLLLFEIPKLHPSV
jgi:hypothetical protein